MDSIREFAQGYVQRYQEGVYNSPAAYKFATALLEALEENERLDRSIRFKQSMLVDLTERIEELERQVKAKQMAIDLRMEEKMLSTRKDRVTRGERPFVYCMNCHHWIAKVQSATEVYESRVDDAERVEKLERTLRHIAEIHPWEYELATDPVREIIQMARDAVGETKVEEDKSGED